MGFHTPDGMLDEYANLADLAILSLLLTSPLRSGIFL